MDALELPDLVISLTEGLIFYTPDSSRSIFKSVLEKKLKRYPKQLFATIKVKDEKLLLWFLIMFLRFLPPVMTITESILLKYLVMEDSDVLFTSLDDVDNTFEAYNS